MDRIYHKSVSHLVDIVSYGTLGVIDSLAFNPNKYEILLVNVATLLRNNYAKDIRLGQMLKSTMDDIEHFNTYATMFCGERVKIVFYLDLAIRDRIPKGQRRELTIPRASLEKAVKAFKSFHNSPGRLSSIGDKVFLYNTTGFAHNELLRVKTRVDKVGKGALVSHCPLDYLIITKDPSIDIIQSHTGNILTLTEISKKVFKNENVPFNTTSLAVFGDKDYIKPQFKSNKRIMTKAGTKYKRLSSYELRKVMMNEHDIETTSMSWL